jgi:hypothetical protein
MVKNGFCGQKYQGTVRVRGPEIVRQKFAPMHLLFSDHGSLSEACFSGDRKKYSLFKPRACEVWAVHEGQLHASMRPFYAL